MQPFGCVLSRTSRTESAVKVANDQLRRVVNDASRDHWVKKQKLAERRAMLRIGLQVHTTAAMALVL